MNSPNRKTSVGEDAKWSFLDYVSTLASGGDWEAYVPPKSTLDIPDYNREMSRVERHFRIVAYGGMLVFALLVCIAYHLAEDTCLDTPSGERMAAFLACVALVVSLSLQLLPVIFSQQRFHMSGVVFAGISVQMVALTANAVISFGNPPVLIDPVTGARVQLLRFAEWTPLACVMTFLVEGSDIPDPRWGLKMVYISALAQSVSTLSGFLFPILPGIKSWLAVLGLAFTLFFFILRRLQCKHRRFGLMTRGERLDETELYHRCKISYQLLFTCAVGWSSLVASHMLFSVAGPIYGKPGSWWTHPELPMIVASLMDVVLKVFYMSFILAMHKNVFDQDARTKRRLEELRQMMWENSSDVLAVSVLSLSGDVTTLVSPTFFKLLKQDNVDSLKLPERGGRGDRGVLFQCSNTDLEKMLKPIGSRPTLKPKLYDFDFGGFSVKSGDQQADVSTEIVGKEEMDALGTLIARSWKCQERDTLLPHNLIMRTDDGDLKTIQCEARVTRIEEAALFVTVRDTSERFRRFEAEKLAVSEMTARRKDMEANRFTRHEVKNGLLASLGLCDSLWETVKSKSAYEALDKISSSLGEDHAAELHSLTRMQDNVWRLVQELDKTLHDVLDTMLAEAMARDVIHEAYKPQLKEVDMEQLLKRTESTPPGKLNRFPLTTSPCPLPTFSFDPQLLQCIHRNAVSNACKYGKRGEVVSTHLTYNEETGMLRMDVKNKPGEKHDEILKLGKRASETMFLPGKRLHSMLGEAEKPSNVSRHSAGDGAWIMAKCAKTLGGTCSIDFREDCTIFTLECPAAVHSQQLQGDTQSTLNFKLPNETWGIALDDSRIQRKLLKRWLEFGGVRKDRIMVLGEKTSDITSFDDFVVEFVDCHPNAYFLIIVDENLDTPVEDTHVHHTTYSGSMLIESIRRKLLPEQECQLLTLVRSANDSLHDVAIYNSRAHGFIPKAPVKEGNILEVLAPLWTSRFADTYNAESHRSFGSRRSSSNELLSLGGESTHRDLNEEDGYLMEHIKVLDGLVEDKDCLEEKWREIWERLHSLKGDLLSLYTTPNSADIVEEINAMRGRHLPANFLSRWQTIRSSTRKECGAGDDDEGQDSSLMF